MRGEEPGGGRRDIEAELTRHLERASDLSARAKRANDAVQHEIDRALEICDELRGVSSESSSRAGTLRSHLWDR
jgi:hypothetical protein